VVSVEWASREERTLLVQQGLGASESVICELWSTHEACHVDEWVEKSGLTSSEVLATPFDPERKGVVRQLPGKQFREVLL
jgi:hypothetical protein